jgi:hypothetical protein
MVETARELARHLEDQLQRSARLQGRLIGLRKTYAGPPSAALAPEFAFIDRLINGGAADRFMPHRAAFWLILAHRCEKQEKRGRLDWQAAPWFPKVNPTWERGSLAPSLMAC